MRIIGGMFHHGCWWLRMLLVVLGSWWTRRYPEYSMSAVVTVVTANNEAVESTAHRLYHRHRQGRQRRRL